MGLLDIFSPIASAVGGVVQGIVDSHTAAENTDKTIAANKSLAEYQYGKDLAMWDKGNAYNAPMAQMERLKSAGLNPNLVYGNGAVGNTSSQLPHYNAPNVQYSYQPPVNIPDVIGRYQDFKIRQAQTNNLREQNAAIRESALQKHHINSVLGNTVSARTWATVHKSNILESQWNQNRLKEKMMEIDRKFRSPMAQTQLDYLKEKQRQVHHSVNQIIENTANTRLKNKYFTTQMFGKMGLDLVGKGLKFTPVGRGAGLGRAAQGNTRALPRQSIHEILNNMQKNKAKRLGID